MFRMRKKNFFSFSEEIVGRINAADGQVLAAAGELVALCHEKAAIDAAAVVAAYAATVPPPAAPAGGPDLEAARQHLAAIEAILDAL